MHLPRLAGAILVVVGGSFFYLLLPWLLSIPVEKFTAKPQYLLATGPYRHTRNPMYLGGITIWLGWTIYYGSLTVLGALILFTGFVMLVLVPWEERLLEKHFGEEYRQYKNTVRRWLPGLS